MEHQLAEIGLIECYFIWLIVNINWIDPFIPYLKYFNLIQLINKGRENANEFLQKKSFIREKNLPIAWTFSLFKKEFSAWLRFGMWTG